MKEETEIVDPVIKDIPDIPGGILEASSRGRLVVFIGAGVSRIVGCPSWVQFAEKLLRKLYENKCVTFHEFENLNQLEPRKLISICMNIIEDKKLQLPDMREFFEADKDLLSKYQIYDDIYKFEAIFITTNYDEYLDKAAEHEYGQLVSGSEQQMEYTIKDKDIKIVYSKDDLLISNLKNKNILHLHGSINEQRNMILSIVDYMKHYERDSKPAVILEEIFRSYTVLFLGYGLEEYEILEFLLSKYLGVKKELQHFMLYPIFREEVNLFKFQKNYYADLGVQLVPYSVSINGYEQLAAITAEWAPKIGSIAKPQGFYDRKKIIDEVT